MHLYASLQTMNNLTEGICLLRKRSGKSQQQFATEVGLSLRAYQKYEQGSKPDARALIRFLALAEDAKFHDLWDLFHQHLVALHLGMPGWLVRIQLKKVDMPKDVPLGPALRWRKARDKK